MLPLALVLTLLPGIQGDDSEAQLDRYGDALPAGAEARLGTKRLRHLGVISNVSYSPDGALIASCGTDGLVRVWASDDGRSVAALDVGTGAPTSATFGAGGALLATTTGRGSPGGVGPDLG